MVLTTTPNRSDRSGRPAHRTYLALTMVLTAVLVLAMIVVAVLVHGGGSSTNGIQGSGVPVTQTRTVAGFTGLDLATTSLDAEIPGSGMIVYGGNPPQVSTSVAGSGSVIRG
jgi:hypothetical protein